MFRNFGVYHSAMLSLILPVNPSGLLWPLAWHKQLLSKVVFVVNFISYFYVINQHWAVRLYLTYIQDLFFDEFYIIELELSHYFIVFHQFCLWTFFLAWISLQSLRIVRVFLVHDSLCTQATKKINKINAVHVCVICARPSEWKWVKNK